MTRQKQPEFVLERDLAVALLLVVPNRNLAPMGLYCLQFHATQG
jgi:hypothetical protein